MEILYKKLFTDISSSYLIELNNTIYKHVYNSGSNGLSISLLHLVFKAKFFTLDLMMTKREVLRLYGKY